MWGLVRAEKTGTHAVRMDMFYATLAHMPHVRAYSANFFWGVSRGCLGVPERQRLGVVLNLFPVARADHSVWLLSVPSIPLIQAARRLHMM